MAKETAALRHELCLNTRIAGRVSVLKQVDHNDRVDARMIS